MQRKIRRGDMFYADLTLGVGSEQYGFRPTLIISNNTGNKHSATVIAAIITSRTEKKANCPRIALFRRSRGLGAIPLFCWSRYGRLIKIVYMSTSVRWTTPP